MEIVTPTQVKEKLAEKSQAQYYDVIQQLPPGGAIKIHPATWFRKESISHYYLTRLKGQVSVRRLNDGYFYIIRLGDIKINAQRK